MTTPAEGRPARRPWGRVVVAVIFLLLAINALLQVALVPLGRSGDPRPLTLLQALVGIAGLAAAWGSWTGARWSPAAAALYGVVTAGMLTSLPWLLDLPAEASGGIMVGAVVVLALSLALAWYLRRTLAAPATR